MEKHACNICGNTGHGREDCRQRQTVIPNVNVPRPPPPPVPEATTTSKSKGCPPALVPKPSQWPSSPAVFVKSFGFKGEGKLGNYGKGIPSPKGKGREDAPTHSGAANSLSAMPGGVAPEGPDEAERPPPRRITREQIQELMAWFEPIQVSTNAEPARGETILWRGLKTGKSGLLFFPRWSTSMARFGT